jgi:SAM-dependent methyltransferase
MNLTATLTRCQIVMRAPKEFVERYYEEYIGDLSRPEGQWVRSQLRRVSGKRILNIGCGPQLFDDAAQFAAAPEELVGVDVNEANIEFLRNAEHPRLVRSRRLLNRAGTRIELMVHDVRSERDEFRSRFDAIYASGLFGMFNHYETAHILNLLFQYLERNGRLVVISWDDDRLSLEKFTERARYSWYQRNGAGLADIENLLKTIGFRMLERDVHHVSDPNDYEWGVIYRLVAQK